MTIFTPEDLDSLDREISELEAKLHGLKKYRVEMRDELAFAFTLRPDQAGKKVAVSKGVNVTLRTAAAIIHRNGEAMVVAELVKKLQRRKYLTGLKDPVASLRVMISRNPGFIIGTANGRITLPEWKEQSDEKEK